MSKYRGRGRGYEGLLCYARRWMGGWDFVVLCSGGIEDSRRRSTMDRDAVSCHDCLDVMAQEDADMKAYRAQTGGVSTY